MEGVGGVWKDTMKQPKIETEMLRLTVNPPPPPSPCSNTKRRGVIHL